MNFKCKFASIFINKSAYATSRYLIKDQKHF